MKKTTLSLLTFAICVLLFAFDSTAQSWQWAKSAGGSGDETGYSVVTDVSGNVYVTGYFTSPMVTFGTYTLNNSSSGHSDFFLVKYDASGNVIWAKSAGGSSDDNGRGLTIDVGGNVYVTGSFSSPSITFGTYTLTNGVGTPYIFLVKYDAGGNVIWAKSAGGSYRNYGYTVATDVTGGNVYLTGYFQGATLTFGSIILNNTTGGSGWSNVYLAKYDAGGNVIWAKSAGGSTDDDQAVGLATDASGSEYITVRFFSPTITFGTYTLTNASSSGSADFCLVKYDAAGNVVWAKNAGSSNHDYAYMVTTDASGNIYATGDFEGPSITFGTTTLNNPGTANMFLVKYDAAGNVVWATSPNGSTFNLGTGITRDASGNIYVTGMFQSATITFGTTTLINASSGTYDVFLVKYDPSGNVLWAKSTGGSSGDQGQSVATDAGGNVYLTGLFDSPSITFGTTNLTNAGSDDFYLAKFSPCTLTTTMSHTNTCSGSSNGTATVTANGGATPYTFLWSNATITQSISNLAAGTYTITVTDAASCSTTNTVTIMSNPLPIANAGNDVSICSGNSTNLTASASGGTTPYSYHWSNGDNNASTTVNPTATNTYIVTVTDANGCLNTDNVVVTVNPQPTVNAGNDVSICSGASTTIGGSPTASGGSGTYTYLWSPTSNLSSSSIANPIASPASTTTYTVTITDSYGCLNTDNVIVSIISSPTATAINNSPVCEGATLTLTGGPGSMVSFSWSGPNSYSSNVQSPTVSTNTTVAMNGTYHITVTDGNGCTGTTSTNVTVNPKPSVSFSSTTPGCTGMPVNFTNTGSSSGVSWLWSFGSSSTPSSATVENPSSVIYSTSGTKNVSLTITNTNTSCVASTTQNITINQTPDAPTASSNSPVNVGSTLSLTASTITGATYNWSGPNGFSSSSQNPAIANVTAVNAGTYSVSATVNGCTGPVGSTSVTITTLTITTSTQNVSCHGGNDGTAAVMSVSGGTPSYSYLWNTTPTQSTEAMIVNLTAGSYTVTVTDADGSSATATVTITQPNAISIMTGGQVNVSCYGGNNGTVHAIAGGGTSPYSYSWNSFPVQTTATAANLPAGSYTVTVTDANGCTGTKTVTITQPAALNISLAIVNADCGTTNGSATANITGGTASYSYLWSTTPSQTTQTATGLSAGNYTVTITDALGCTMHSTATIGIIPANFNLSFSTSPHSGAAPLYVTFENTTPNPSNYNFTWYHGDGSIANDNSTYVYYTYNFAGLYDVALIATKTSNGCTDTLVVSHDVSVSGTGCTHTASVTPTGPINQCQGDTVTLTANTTAVAPFTYQWNIGSVAISGAVNSTLEVTQGGYFSVTVIKNNCPVTSSAVQINFATNPQQPQITAIGSIVPCVGGSVTLTASSGYSSYLWSTGATTQSINDTLSGTFTVEGFNSNGCGNISDPYSVNASLLQSQEICIVTVDSTSTKNLIIWEKPISTVIDSFKIYREISSSYFHIASIPYSAQSIYTDLTTGVNPNTTAYKYKISVVDTCGNESALSSYHRTIHVAISPASPCGYNLIWNDYIGFPVTQYLIYRDSSNTGWVKKDSVSFGNTSWTDFTCYPANDTIAYLVEAVNPAGCNPTKAAGHNSSRSNVQRNYAIISSIAFQPSGNDLNLKIYPNPANTNIYIESENDLKDAIITIYNIHSQIQLQLTLQKKITELDISKLLKGVYIIKVVSEKGIVVKKLIKE